MNQISRRDSPAADALRDVSDVVRVELIGIAGGGHTWPGSSRFTGWLGEANRTMNMNRVMREFMTDASEMTP